MSPLVQLDGLPTGCDEKTPSESWVCTSHGVSGSGETIHYAGRHDQSICAVWAHKDAAVEMQYGGKMFPNWEAALEAFYKDFPEFEAPPSEAEVEAAITGTIAMMKELEA